MSSDPYQMMFTHILGSLNHYRFPVSTLKIKSGVVVIFVTLFYLCVFMEKYLKRSRFSIEELVNQFDHVGRMEENLPNDQQKQEMRNEEGQCTKDLLICAKDEVKIMRIELSQICIPLKRRKCEAILLTTTFIPMWSLCIPYFQTYSNMQIKNTPKKDQL